MTFKSFVAALLAAGLMAGAAQGAEIRVGGIVHDALGLDAGVSGKEKSGGITIGLVTQPLRDGHFWLSPRLEIGGDVNLGGKTNLAYAGLLWRGHFGAQRRIYAELALGLAVHDGELDIPNLEPGLSAEETQRRIYMNANFIEFGNRVLFREAIALGYRFNDDWAADVYLEHFSHGNILSSGPNEGLDTVGFRISRRLW